MRKLTGKMIVELAPGVKSPVAPKAGDVLFIPAGLVHPARNVGIGNRAELATCIIETGKPLLTLVN